MKTIIRIDAHFHIIDLIILFIAFLSIVITKSWIAVLVFVGIAIYSMTNPIGFYLKKRKAKRGDV